MSTPVNKAKPAAVVAARADAPAGPSVHTAAPSPVAAITTAAVSYVGFDPTTAAIIRVVTVPLHKLRAGDVLYCKALKAIYQAKPLKNDKDSDDKEAPHMLDIVNLQTGELEQVICGASLIGIFEDEYPNNAYVGKGFKITVGDQKASKGGGGKRYNTYTVFEIALPQ